MNRRMLVPLLLGVVAVAVVATHSGAVPRPGRTERISIGLGGADPNDRSWGPSISADGRYVAFGSTASNLVPADDNEAFDAFVYDRVTRRMELVGSAPDGSAGVGGSGHPSLNADGRYVAFHSNAPNLVPDDWNLAVDVFVRDRLTGVTELVSVTSSGEQANGGSIEPTISADGRYVAFQSSATNLSEGDTNEQDDLFLHDRATGATTRISIPTGGGLADDQSFDAVISADGRHVAFRSWATNLVEGDTNGFADIFVHDAARVVTERVSIASDGSEATWWSANPSISADGRLVAFDSAAENLVPADNEPAAFVEATFGSIDVFVHDRQTGRTERASVTSAGEEGGGGSGMISASGRYVVFSGRGLVDEEPGDNGNLYVRDLVLGTTERASLALDGGEPTSWQEDPAISADGQIVAFATRDGALVPPDGNNEDDIYLRDRGPGLGIGELEAAGSQGSVRVSGWSRVTGTLWNETDLGTDGVPAAEPAGGELVDASVAYRPEEGDLLATLRVTRIPGLRSFRSALAGVLLTNAPGVAGTPALLYGLELTSAGTTYQLRALRVAVTGEASAPLFGLYRCEATACAKVAALRGGLGTTGNEVRIAVPLARIGATAGGEVTGARAFAALGEAAAPAVSVLDEVTLGNLRLDPSGVEVGIGPAGTPQTEIDFVPAAVELGVFEAELDTTGLSSGPHDVWARVCLGTTCEARRTSIEL